MIIYLIFREASRKTRSKEAKPKELYKIFKDKNAAEEYKEFCKQEEPSYEFNIEEWELN